jgi:hypothetical protein
VLAVAVSRTTEAPYVIGALLMLYGYLRSMLRREPRFGNKQYRRYLRRYEWRVLLRGKRTVLAQANDRIRRERATPP